MVRSRSVEVESGYEIAPRNSIAYALKMQNGFNFVPLFLGIWDCDFAE